MRPFPGHEYRILTWQEAQLMVDFRIDRRRIYKWAYDYPSDEPELFVREIGTRSCSGCSCDCESCCMRYNSHRAAGCSECGYTGKRRNE